eukprot:gnl/TRDRNA2_/TRDRNA2_184949_c0_seq1.p1 gnl/TRDRNA2_/TRDRNA2_184949_c0~~gnl/TRDRNA2_/TRDRNA2_184949_c0_seq1.p1  ORF type:complete len:169 (-),score=23.30 gnl/TRDRNA2_/TRDRNA2_184949_c0_seq1:93-533(-)
MGAAVCNCLADSSKDKDIHVPSMVNTMDEDGPLAVQLSKSTKTMSGGGPGHDSSVDMLAGQWCLEVDGRPMGEIRSGSMVWEGIYQHQPSPIRRLPDGSFEMELSGEVHRALHDEGPPQSLKWSDGEVWLKTKGSMGLALTQSPPQ